MALLQEEGGGPIYTDIGIRFNKCIDIRTSHTLKQGWCVQKKWHQLNAIDGTKISAITFSSPKWQEMRQSCWSAPQPPSFVFPATSGASWCTHGLPSKSSPSWESLSWVCRSWMAAWVVVASVVVYGAPAKRRLRRKSGWGSCWYRRRRSLQP